MSLSNGIAKLRKRNELATKRLVIPPSIVAHPPAPKKEQVRISAPNMKVIRLRLIGTAPYLQCRFPVKAMNIIMAKQQAGDKGNTGKRAPRAARDYQADYLGSMHKMNDKQCGIPAAAFRAACISACRLVGFKMTIAKMSIFIVADGYDIVDQTALVKIEGKPAKHQMMGRNADGSVDVRTRAIWKEWACNLTVKFDEDQFNTADVVNLISRVGQQVGIGEGRPDGRKSAGMGFGLFDVET